MGNTSMKTVPPFDGPGSRLALEQMSDLCLWVDPRTGHILDANAALKQSLGWPLHELLGQPLQMLAAADPAGEAWQAMSSGGTLADADITVVGRDGTAHPMSASAWLVQHDGDEPPGLGFMLWRNVSRRRLDEAALLESRARLQSLAYEVTVAEARERSRIAAGLHDDIGQILAMAHLKLGELGAAATPQARAQHQEELRGMLAHAMRATRSATFDLRSPLPQQLGLAAAIEALGERVERASRLRVCVAGQAPAQPLAEPVLSIVFRVVRELLFNIQKHAQARQVQVQLRSFDDQLMISVADDGVGFDAAARPRCFSREGGFGLFSAEAQLQAIGGRLRIESGPGRGTQATVTVPLPQADARADVDATQPVPGEQA
jgi:signal transduction histidine kinase